MKKTCLWILAFVVALLTVFGLSCFSAWIFMLLWNWILPTFGVITLTFWQSFGVILLLSIIGNAINGNSRLYKIKEELQNLKNKSTNEVEEEITPVPVDIKVDLTVNSSNEVDTDATVNNVPMKKVEEETTIEISQETIESVDDTSKEEIKVAKKPSRSRNRKKKSVNKDEVKTEKSE